MSEELCFQHVAIALRYQYGPEAIRAAIRHADCLRQNGDCERAAMWMKVAAELVESAIVACAASHLGG